MNSFQSIAKKKEEELKKLQKKGFESKTPNSSKPTNRAIGGAAPVSVNAIARLDDLEGAITDAEEVVDRVDTLETTATTNSNNISTLDTAVTTALNTANQVGTDLTALSTVVDGKSDIGHLHPTTYLTSAQVTSLVLQLLEDTGAVTPPGTDVPTISAGQYGSDFTYAEEWGDDFLDADAETLFNRWHPDLMQDGLNQAGNSGEDGWRWSANYTQPQETAFIDGDALNLRAKVDVTPNPFRKAYTFRGETMNPQDQWIYLPFLTTWARKYDSGSDAYISDPDAPNRTWGPGTVFEFEVDLTEMRTQACRMSFWLMPAYENDSNAYTPDGTLAVEADITEVDFLDGYENYSQSKTISGLAANNTPVGSIDLDTIINGIDLTSGTHTFTLLWAKDRFVWYVNGVEIQRDTDPRRIPQTPHYLIISREANSGVKAKRSDNVLDDGTTSYSDGTLLLPQDTGLWAQPVYVEMDRLHNDNARVNSFKSFSFIDNSTAGVGIGDDTTGISPTMISANPSTNFGAGTTLTFTWLSNGRVVSDWYFELGYTRGGNELGSATPAYPATTVNIFIAPAYNGPINGRLWFREDANSVWNWRDFGFSSGLQAYRTGTDGEISVTVPTGTGTTSLPTVAGLGNLGVDLGSDGTYATGLNYTGGAVPAGYTPGFTPPDTGVVGTAPPDYEGTGTATLRACGALTFNQYPNETGELLWGAPSILEVNEEYELVVNGLIVFKGLANSFFVEGYPVNANNTAGVRLVLPNGEFGPESTLTFATVVL